MGAGCYYAGWAAAKGYLGAAIVVASQTKAALDRSIEYADAMDKLSGESASLRAAITTQTEVMRAKQADVEYAIQALLHGFERAGMVPARRTGPPRQVGEESREQG